MLRTPIPAVIMALLLTAIAATLHGQCLTAPPPDNCLGTEPSPSNAEVLGVGTKKWHYGAPAVFSQLTLRGGTLVVCTELTINDFIMDSGTVVVRPGATLHLGSGAGIVLRGNSALYNYGTLELLANLVLDNTWVSAAKPNVVINATSSAFFKMSNQYFVINNPFSFFVNNGRSDFHGIITDYGAAIGSVCLGTASQTNMTVLYNNRKDTYVAPGGAACVRVSQYSQFRDTLTDQPNVNVCLGSAHTSDACGACRPNAWGTPYINQFCSDCATITLLTVQPRNLTAGRREQGNMIQVTPNPFSQAVNIIWRGTKKPAAVTIAHISGVVVYHAAVRTDNTGTVSIPLAASLPAGGYVVKVMYADEVLLRKIVKQ
jgi:hypothetical protein